MKLRLNTFHLESNCNTLEHEAYAIVPVGLRIIINFTL